MFFETIIINESNMLKMKKAANVESGRLESADHWAGKLAGSPAFNAKHNGQCLKCLALVKHQGG